MFYKQWRLRLPETKSNHHRMSKHSIKTPTGVALNYFRLPEINHFLLPHGFGKPNGFPFNFNFKEIALAISNPCGI
ncbi:MAG: hypothetical protein J6T41_04645 [Neisseriaceae bacterium]|nr:hypothetical protein [Neisseriaceae bacterium]